MSQTDKQDYQGSCHCGSVTFTVSGTIAKGAVCDCSICRRKGAVMAAVEPERFAITSGEENISLYQFNTRAARHHFCKICGIYKHHKRRRDDMIGINTGCLDGFDKKELDEIMEIKGSEFSVVEDKKSFHKKRL